MAKRTLKFINNGNDLAEALGLPVNEGRFHHEGHYERPSKYPCAFFDKHGFMVVDSYTTLTGLAHVSKKVNFARPVSRMKGYKYREDWRDRPRIVDSLRTRRKLAKLIHSKGGEEKSRLLQKLGLRPIDQV